MRAASAAEPPWPETLDELKERIEWTVRDRKVPAIGIALVNRDGPVWVAGWGRADLASGRAADQDTLFRIGSVTKMFAAFAVLKLVEEGRLSLDDKVRDRVPEIAFENAWEATHPLRIVHLLEHTTGWDDGHLPEYVTASPDSMTTKQGLDHHPDSRVSRWPPGTRHAYNNIGPAVAAYIVEKVTGQRFEDYVASTILVPLGMESTSYFRTPKYDERRATLYVGAEPAEYWHMIHRPAGAMNSSARDMANFVQFLLERGSIVDRRVVSEASFDRMETPGTLPGNALGVLSGYGLYNYTSGYAAQGVAFHGHNGGVMGGLTELAYVPKLGEGYVFMINNMDTEAQRQISDLLKGYLLRDVPWPDVKPAALPDKYKHIDGWYQAINPRGKNMLLSSSLMSFVKVTHDDRYLHRSPLLGSWTSADYVGPRDVLVEGWSGLPSITIVDDVLAGPVLQVSSDYLMRVATWKVFARFGVPLLMIVMSVVGLISFIVWVVRRRRQTTPDSRLWLRLWPLVATAVLVAYLVIWTEGALFLELLGKVSWLSVAILLLSLAYPAAALLGAGHLFSSKAREQMDRPYWFAAAFCVVHLLIAGYLAMFGAIATRTWA